MNSGSRRNRDGTPQGHYALPDGPSMKSGSRRSLELRRMVGRLLIQVASMKGGFRRNRDTDIVALRFKARFAPE
jgi:hypothetical protein